MSEADQRRPAASDVRVPTTAEMRYFNWPVLMVTLALICTLAWNVALLWGAVHIYQIMFS
jgi:hypothetical protein